MSISHLNTLIEKTSNWDKDERYMATNDICNEISKEIKIDEATERRICAAVLKQLDDKSNDVQSVAVKCLAILLKKVQHAQVAEICEKLSSLLLDGKDALRDIYSIGLKTLIADVPDEMGSLISERLSGRLLNGISRTGSEEVKKECLDNLSDLLRRFGHLIEREHDDIMNVVLRQLENDQQILRKRAAVCLGSLSVVSSDVLLNRLVESILKQISAIETSNRRVVASDRLRIFIQTIGTISKAVGQRLTKHLDQLFPLFLRMCGDAADESLQTDAGCELRENCLAALASLAGRCGSEAALHLEQVVGLCMSFMEYDPNYSYDDGNSGDAMDDCDDEEEEEQNFDDQDENDDISWKVRKIALKVLATLVASPTAPLEELFRLLTDPLLARFKEREENVRVDVVLCLNGLLEASCRRKASRGGRRGGADRESGVAGLELVADRLPLLVAASCRALSPGPLPSARSRGAVFLLLRSLLQLAEGHLDLQPHLQQLLAVTERCLQDKEQVVRLEALVFLRSLLAHSAPIDALPRLLPLLADAAAGYWAKTAIEALFCVQAAIVSLSSSSASSCSLSVAAVRGLAADAARLLLTLLMRPAQDHDRREIGIATAGSLLAHLGDQLEPAQLQSMLSAFLRMLSSNEYRLSRTSVLKAISSFSAAPLDLSSFISAAIGPIALLLSGQQHNRLLRLTALSALMALATHTTAALAPTDCIAVMREAAAAIEDTDQHLCCLAVQVAQILLDKFPSTALAQQQQQLAYPKLLQLVRSPLLQGQCLAAVQTLFGTLCRGAHGLRCGDVIRDLHALSPAGSSPDGLSRLGFANIAKCIAAACLGESPDQLSLLVAQLAVDLQQPSPHLALLVLAELGSQLDYSSLQAPAPPLEQLRDLVVACFESPSEQVTAAAGSALGRLAAGNQTVFLSHLLICMQAADHRQYLFLSALREVVTSSSPPLQQVLPPLLGQLAHPEEAVRNTVAECLGQLACREPLQVLPQLLDAAASDRRPLLLWTVYSSFRYALGTPHAAESTAGRTLSQALEDILPLLLQTEDLLVRRALLMLANAALHRNPHLVGPALLSGHLLPALAATLGLKQERVVDLGPFKHKVDDALVLRKASLTVCETLLDCEELLLGAAGPLLLEAFLSRAQALLTDKDADLKLQALQVLVKVCRFSPSATAAQLDTLLDSLEKLCVLKVSKEGESEGCDGGVKTALRGLTDLHRALGEGGGRRWADLIARLSKKETTGPLLTTLLNSSDHTPQ